MNRSRRARIPLAVARGVTLIEVLVTMIVVALGFLGHAKLLTTTISHNNSAYLRSLATMLAYEAIECMRANRVAAINGGYNIAIGHLPAATTLAGSDLAYWKTRISESLPVGDGSVTVDHQGNAIIVIEWDDNRDGDPITLTTQTAL